MSKRIVRVAAVQMVSENGATEKNLAVATPLVADAAAQGAELVLLPELFAIGYELSEKAWAAAEPEGGVTEQWLCDAAARHSIYLGGSYLQAEGEDFYDVFSLASPGGEIVGRVSKQFAGYVEPYVFKGKASNRVIETDLGRIAVAVCYDSCFRSTSEAVIAADADLLLIPLCGPTPQKRWYYSKRRMEQYNNTYRYAASKCASLLGIPVVMANKCGPWSSDMPGILPSEASWFYGRSEISDAQGRSLKELDDSQAVIVADVELSPDDKVKALPASQDQYGKWNGPVPSEFKILWLFEWLGRRSYANNPRRMAAARKVSGLKVNQASGVD